MKNTIVIFLACVAMFAFVRCPVKSLAFESLVNEIVFTSPVPKQPEHIEKDKPDEAMTIITQTQVVTPTIRKPTRTRYVLSIHRR